MSDLIFKFSIAGFIAISDCILWDLQLFANSFSLFMFNYFTSTKTRIFFLLSQDNLCCMSDKLCSFLCFKFIYCTNKLVYFLFYIHLFTEICYFFCYLRFMFCLIIPGPLDHIVMPITMRNSNFYLYS